MRALSRLKAGDYYVQAVLIRYETFRRGDDVTIKLAPDKGEGQQWNEKPGNLYSKPVTLPLGPGQSEGAWRFHWTRKIAPITPKTDHALRPSMSSSQSSC